MTERIAYVVRAAGSRPRLTAVSILAILVAVLAWALDPPAYPALTGERLAGGEETAGGYFGRSVAITPDGSTAIVGGPRDSENSGGAWIFARSGASWAQQGPKLTGAGETGQGAFGWSVAISADGATAVVGGNDDDRGGRDIESGDGAAWIFTRSGSGGWVQRGGKLGPPDEAGKGHFGDSVAVSADGSTVVVGGSEDGGTGAAWVFARRTEAGGEPRWSEQAKLTATSGEAAFGRSVSVSADGNTVLVGSPRSGGGAGAAYVFVRSGIAWSQQGGALRPGDESGLAELGYTVSLSADGNTALAGAPKDEGGLGAAWLFSRSGDEWRQLAPKLRPRVARHDGHFGASVALSPEATTALIGAPLDGIVTRKQGAAWTFKSVGGGWVQTGVDYVGVEATGEESEDEAEAGSFGRAVATSGNGYVVLVGAPRDSANTGFAWSYLQQPPIVVTGGATRTTESTAVVSGTVDPEGALVSDCRFEYGLVAFEASVPCERTPGPEGLPVPVFAEIAGLAPGTLYRYRLVATTTGGSAAGDTRLLATRPPGSELSGLPKGGGTGSPDGPSSTRGGSGSGGALGSSATSSGSGCVVALAARTSTVGSGSRVPIRLSRSGAFAGPCRGKLRLTVRTGRGKLRARTIAAGSYVIASRRTVVVRLKLNALGRSLLRRNPHGLLNARLVITQLSPGPTRARAASLRIRRSRSVALRGH